MNIRLTNKGGFTLIEIMIVVAIIGMLVAMAVPNLSKNRDTARVGAIQNNLRVIKTAKLQWSIDNKMSNGDVPTPEQLSSYMEGQVFPPSAVAGETYNINPLGTDPTATLKGKLADYNAGDTIAIQY